MDRLYILDGSGYIYRAYYGIGGNRGRAGAQLSTVSGMPTGALYVYTQMLVRLARDIKPERIVVVFDAPGRTFRKELHAEYKATRRETPDDLKPQLPLFPEITRAFRWPVLAVPGVEADDVIATLVARARARSWNVTIFSADKDVMQLVSADVEVIDSLRNVTYDAATVKDKYGVLPEQLRDYLALVGDSSDNVPGMKGVGKVTAASLLARYGSIDSILAHASELKGKQKELFTSDSLIEQLRLSRKLVTLEDNVALDTELDTLQAGTWDGPGLVALFQRLEFHVLIERLGPVGEANRADSKAPGASSRAASPAAGAASRPGDDAEPTRAASTASTASIASTGRSRGKRGEARPAQTELDWSAPASDTGARKSSNTAEHTPGAAVSWQAPADPPAVPAALVVASPAELVPLAAAAQRAGKLAIQVESDGARPDRARIIGVTLAVPGEAALYIPVAHRYLGAPAQIDLARLPGEILAVLADPALPVVCHDAKTTYRALAQAGVEVAGIAADTMLAAYLLDPDQPSSAPRSLARVVRLGSGQILPERKTLLGKGRTRIDFDAVAVTPAAEWSSRAACGVLLACDALDERLREAGMHSLMHDVELPLALLLAEIEKVGICIDVPYVRTLAARVRDEVAGLERRIHELAGEEVNLGSPKQLAALLFDKLGLDSDKKRKTKTGYSTDHEVLDSLADAHPIIPLLIEHRELVKLQGTYLDALPPLVNPHTGRIHTSFNQAIAATGRISSQDPNLQNIPIRSELGREIRRAFVAAEGYTLVSVDYSQIELRILAHLSGDPVLVKAFREGIDVHAQTAAEVFGIALADVGPNERRVAKAVNYGLIYGQSQFGLAQTLGISRTEAKEYMTRYFTRFSRVQKYMDECIQQAARSGYAVTLLGRRRLLSELGSGVFQRRKLAERMAQNTPMQGSAADIMKLAMLRVAARLARDKLDARILLTVHDELVFEVVPDQAEALAGAASAEMEAAYRLDVPLETTTGIARSWADAH